MNKRKMASVLPYLAYYKNRTLNFKENVPFSTKIIFELRKDARRSCEKLIFRDI